MIVLTLFFFQRIQIHKLRKPKPNRQSTALVDIIKGNKNGDLVSKNEKKKTIQTNLTILLLFAEAKLKGVPTIDFLRV